MSETYNLQYDKIVLTNHYMPVDDNVHVELMTPYPIYVRVLEEGMEEGRAIGFA